MPGPPPTIRATSVRCSSGTAELASVTLYSPSLENDIAPSRCRGAAPDLDRRRRRGSCRPFRSMADTAGIKLGVSLASVPRLYPEISRAQMVGGSQISYWFYCVSGGRTRDRTLDLSRVK